MIKSISKRKEPESNTMKMWELVSRILVSKDNPGEHARDIITWCKNAEVRQENW